MFVANTTSELLNLFLALDAQENLPRKVSLLEDWGTRLSHSQKLRIFWYDGNFAELEDGDRSFSPESPVIITDVFQAPPIARKLEGFSSGSLFYPLPSKAGESPGFFLFQSENPGSLLTENSTSLGLAASKFKDILALDNAAKVKVLSSPGSLEEHHLYDPEYRYILETLNLPLYLAHLSGEFIFANQPFLMQFGFASLDELNQNRQDFFNVTDRANQTKELAEKGSVFGFQLSINLPTGRRVTVRDYATLQGGHILGVLFDVSDYVNLNREMKEALEIQELLNDQIISSALILQKTQTTSIRALARLAEYRDQETGGHLQRICEYTEVLAREVFIRQPYNFKITEQYVNDMVLSSMLHDIGKVAVPDQILRKKNNLSPAEWEVMKKHTLWGWQILNQADKELGEQSFLTLASQIALNHHEKWDGSGYPGALKGEKIPLSARIESIADVYDALTSVRPYKRAWSHEEAIEEISSQRGVQFDPVLVDILVSVQDTFQTIKSRYSGETSQ